MSRRLYWYFIFVIISLLSIPILSIADDSQVIFISDIVLSENDVVLLAGNKIKISAEIIPENASNLKLEWSTTDENVALVDKGTIVAKGAGKCDIICSSTDGSGVNQACHVEVRIPVKSITINEKQPTVIVGASEELAIAKLTYSVAPENAFWQDVIWKSSDNEIATVSADGIIRGIKPGKVVVAASSSQPGSKVKAQVKVIVQQAVTDIEHTDEVILVPVGKNARIKATVIPENAANKKLEWTSSDETIATVRNGSVNGVGIGKAVITASALDGSGVHSDVEVEVIRLVKRINVEDKEIELGPGMVWKQSFSFEPEDASYQRLNWTSSDELVATVDENGVIKANRKGHCRITGMTIDGSKISIVVGLSVGYQKDACFGLKWGTSLSDALKRLKKMNIEVTSVKDNGTIYKVMVEPEIKVKDILTITKLVYNFTKVPDNKGGLLSADNDCILFSVECEYIKHYPNANEMKYLIEMFGDDFYGSKGRNIEVSRYVSSFVFTDQIGEEINKKATKIYTKIKLGK